MPEIKGFLQSGAVELRAEGSLFSVCGNMSGEQSVKGCGYDFTILGLWTGFC